MDWWTCVWSCVHIVASQGIDLGDCFLFNVRVITGIVLSHYLCSYFILYPFSRAYFLDLF